MLYYTTHHTDFTKTNSSNSVASNLVAGNNIDIATNKTYNQKGSNLLSQNGNIDIKAKTANISAGENSFISEYGSKTITAGVSVGNNGVGLSAGYNQSDNFTLQNNHNNSKIEAKNGTFKIDTAKDTNIKGGVIVANKVDVNVGGDLNIETIQDSYEQQGSSFGVNVSAYKSGKSNNKIIGGMQNAMGKLDGLMGNGAENGKPSSGDVNPNIGISFGATDIYSKTTVEKSNIQELSTNRNIDELVASNNKNNSKINIAGNITNLTEKEDKTFINADFEGGITIPTKIFKTTQKEVIDPKTGEVKTKREWTGLKEIADANKNLGKNLKDTAVGFAKTTEKIPLTPAWTANQIEDYTEKEMTWDTASKPAIYKDANDSYSSLDANANNIGDANIADEDHPVGTEVDTSDLKWYSTNEGAPASNALNKTPGLNSAVAVPHDKLTNSGIMSKSPLLEASIIPSIPIGYYGLIGKSIKNLYENKE